MNKAATIAQKLLQIKAIKLSPQSPFTWSSGIQSPIYCDNRIVLSYPKVRNLIKQAFVESAKEFGHFNKIAGVATGGIAHGALVADILNMPFIYIRSKAKGHGRQNLIEGELKGEERILVIEDLISTGGSSLKAVEAVRETGATVVGVLAIFSYGFKKTQIAFETANCPLKTLSNYSVLINEAVKTNYIQNSDVQLLENWLQEVNTSD